MTNHAIRVVHVSSAHPWTDNRIHYRECQSLSKHGYDVILVAVESQIPDARPVVRVIAAPPITNRVKRSIVGSVSALRKALSLNPTVVHLHDPELIWAIPVLRVMGIRVIYDAHEDLPQQILHKSYMSESVKRVISCFGKFLVKLSSLASHVIVATETIADRYPPNKTTVIHNYPPVGIEATCQGNAGRENTAVYIGGITVERGVQEMIAATHDPLWPDTWNLVLAGPASQDVVHLVVDKVSNPRVSYLGNLSPDQAKALLHRAKLGLCVVQDNPAYRLGLPTKVFEYMEAHLPVVLSQFPLWQDLFGEFAILIDQTSPTAIANAVLTYSKDAELYSSHSRSARALSEERFNWAHEEQVLLAVYSTLVR